MKTTGIIMPGLIGYTQDGEMIREIRTRGGVEIVPKQATNNHPSNDSDDGEWSDDETVPVRPNDMILKRKSNTASTGERTSKRPANQPGKQNPQTSAIYVPTTTEY
jgi:hypothetical protein